MNQDLSMKEGGSDNPSVQALADHLMSIARHERMVWLMYDYLTNEIGWEWKDKT